MRDFGRVKRFSVSAFCGLAVAAAAQTAAAQTAFNCGSLPSSENYPDATYASAIIRHHIAGAINMTIPGTATGTTISTGNGQYGSGILATPRNGNNRPVNITIGGTGPVHIRQTGSLSPSVWAHGRGINVAIRSGGAQSTVKMNIGTSGTGEVTIGTATTRMNSHGIEVKPNNLNSDSNAGDVCIATAATIYANAMGIRVDDGKVAGSVTIYNTGDLTTGSRGIHANNPNSGSGDVTVTNLGTILTGNQAIHAASNSQGTVSVSVTNSGTLGRAATATTVASRVTDGIEALHRRGAAGTVSVSNSGDITASGWGIRAWTQAGSGADITVGLTSGSIDANGGRNAVEAGLEGAGGSIAMTVAGGATVVSRRHAGIAAQMTHADNAAGTIAVTQGGTIMGRTGVLAYATRASAAMETRAASAQPLIDVTWKGTFSHGTTATVAADDTGRREADNADQALGAARAVDAEDVTRYGAAAGIEAFALNPWDAATTVATGDDPGAIANAVTQMALLAASGAGSKRTEILAAFKAALGNEDVAVAAEVFGAINTGATDLSDVTDTQIVTWLSANNAGRRTFLQRILARSLSDKEKAVLRALVTDTGLDAALDDADAGFSADYKTAVKALLDRYNLGDIRVRVNGGSIVSRGDGVRAYYATPHDDNGRIDVTIAAGTTVSGDMAGVYVANAGMGEVTTSSGWGRDLLLSEAVTLRQHFVTVNGRVTGGSDAAVHLAGGGALLVGETGQVIAGDSGVAIKVNEPGRSEIVINGEVRGSTGAAAAIDVEGGGTITIGLTGMVVADGATSAIRARMATGSTATTRVVLHAPGSDVEGRLSREAAEAALARAGGAPSGNGVAGNQVVFGFTDDEGDTGIRMVSRTIQDGAVPIDDLPSATPPTPPTDPTDPVTPVTPPVDPDDPMRMLEMECDAPMDRRCRLYEALPSILLGMNGLPSRQERLAAAQDGRGGWARVEAAAGKWRAETSTRPNVAYDGSRFGIRAGLDAALGEDARAGLSMHGLRGSAKMTGEGGEVALSGLGLGAQLAASAPGGVYIDAQAALTKYEAKLTSATDRVLKDDATGTGWALALEVGRPVVANPRLTLTPRVGMVWSQVSLNDFTDSRLDTEVSMDTAQSVTGRVGLDAALALGDPEELRVFGSVEAIHEVSRGRETRVLDTRLNSSTGPVGARLSVGAAHGWTGPVRVRASAYYETGDGGSGEHGGDVVLSVRF